MTQTRRDFLKAAGAGGLAVLAGPLAFGARAAPAQPIVIEARPGTAQLLEPPAGRTAIWGFDGRVPGPLLRAKRGEELWVRLVNRLPDQATTIHWHGIRIDNRMDGVGHLTQEPVPPGESFDYRFNLPDAGTFWYHPHHISWQQVARGLYGLLIVEEDEPVDVDQDIAFVVDDWRLEESGAIHEASFGDLHDWAHLGRLGNVLTVNGAPEVRLPVISGERVRLRLANTCNARILTLRFESVSSSIVALDGQPVTPVPLKDGTIEIAPGQRADLAIDMTAAPGTDAAITEISQERVVIGAFVHAPAGQRQSERPALALPHNGLPEPDLASAQHVELAMAGGAMGMMGLDTVMHAGRRRSMRELVREDRQVWVMNGVAGMPQQPLLSVPRGRSVVLRFANDTMWPHAMHVHGHHMRSLDARGAALGPWRDTVLIERQQTLAVAFVADNPGRWMIHCHMLEHQAGGMETWFEVT